VRPGSLSFNEAQAPVEEKAPLRDPQPTAAQNSRALFALQQELSHALQAQLHAMLNAQIQQILPQLHESIDAAVHEAVANAIVARVAAAD
jgi:hypothetical protein